MKKILSYAVLAAALFSCNIDRTPPEYMSSKQITDNPQSSLNALINGMYSQLKDWSDPMHRCGEYAGDNMMIRGSSTDSFYEFISFSRTPVNGRLTQFWDRGYKAIAQASNIINMIGEGKSKEIDAQIGQCYYVRGMMYFYLCRAYGRPYYQDPEKNLGVPIVNGTPKNVLTDLHLPDRSTVAQTYEQAIKDLEKAIELLPEGTNPIRATRGAAEAMLSRIYLYMSGTYEVPNVEYARKAVEYATRVIDSGKYKLLDRGDFMKYNRLAPEANKESIFVVKRVASEFTGYDHYYGVGGMYANIGGMGWGEMYASAKYIDLLNETGRNDWRPDSYKIVDARAAFIEPTYAKNSEGGYTEVFRFIDQDAKGSNALHYFQLEVKRRDGKIFAEEKIKKADKTEETKTYELTVVNEQDQTYSIEYRPGVKRTGMLDYYITLNRAYPQFYITKCSREGEDSHLHSPVISRLGEIYLNRAEAQAKLGNYAEALADLNRIRTRSIPGKGYAALDATTAPKLIDKERQLELAYQAERSYDVFRNGMALQRHYPGPHKQMEDIPATDYRVVYYIPQSAINSYAGTLTQNPTKN